MKLPVLLFCSAFVLTGNGVFSILGQTPPEDSEVRRLKKENQQLRRQLAEALGKLPGTSANPSGRDQTSSTPAAAKPAARRTDTAAAAAESTEPEPSSAHSFIDRLFLRKSVFDEETLSPGQITNPAQFTYVHPGHGNDSYSIDAGLAATFLTPQPGKWQMDWGIGADYHRNSDATSTKNLFQTGVIADAIFGNAAESDFVRSKANVSYKDNNVKDLQSVAAGLDILPVVAFLKIDNFHRAGPAHWRWQPFAGLRYEGAFDQETGLREGHWLAARYGVEVQIFPLFDYIKRSVEVTTNYTMWSDLSSTGPYKGKNWNGYLDIEATYWFNGGASAHKGKMDVGVGLSYQNGDNSELDVTDADLLVISLKAKF